MLRRVASQAAKGFGQTARRAFASQQCPHDASLPFHKSPLPIDHAGGLLEYSVVYTDRAMNHMSKPFCNVRMPPDTTFFSIFVIKCRRRALLLGSRAKETASREAHSFFCFFPPLRICSTTAC